MSVSLKYDHDTRKTIRDWFALAATTEKNGSFIAYSIELVAFEQNFQLAALLNCICDTTHVDTSTIAHFYI